MRSAPKKRELRFNPASSTSPAMNRRPEWLLFIPLVFHAARGAFSFQTAGEMTGGFSPGAVQVREPGLLGGVILPAAAYAIILWLMRGKLRVVLLLAKEYIFISLLAALTVVSTLWSQNPTHSSMAAMCFCLDTLFAFYLVSSFDPKELMTVLERLLLVICILSLLMIFFFPQYGLSQLDPRNPGAWAGIFNSRSAASKPLLFLTITCMELCRQRFTMARGGTIIVAFLFLYETHTMTTVLLVALYFGYLTFQSVNKRLGPRTSSILISVMTGCVLACSLISAKLLPTLLQGLGRDPTLTGRTEIWSVLIESVMKRPLLGYGYYAFWEGLHGESGIVIHRLNWTFGYAHNGYLEMTLQLGILGLTVFLITLAQAIRNAWTCLRFDRTGRSDWFVGIILLTIVFNFDDCTVLWPRDLASVLYIVAYCGLSIRARQLRQTTTPLVRPAPEISYLAHAG